MPNKFSSLETISNSICYDRQVSRWFLLLVNQAPARKKVLANFPDGKTDYKQLKLIFWQEVCLNALGLGLLAAVLQTKFFLGYLVVLWTVFLSWKIMRQRRQVVAAISTKLLSLEFPAEELPPKTLYQIAEILSRSYRIPSLVDTIFTWDYLLRVGILSFLVVLLAIKIKIPLWQEFLGIYVMVGGVSLLLQLPFFYRKFL